jgi:hypothetical protein
MGIDFKRWREKCAGGQHFRDSQFARLNRAAQESARETDCTGKRNDVFVAAPCEGSFHLTESVLFQSSEWHTSVQEVQGEEDYMAQ